MFSRSIAVTFVFPIEFRRSDFSNYPPRQDLSLPRTMVQRLAKGVIPANTQIQKDAITAMSKSATLFVNYLAHAYVHPSFHVPQSPSKTGATFHRPFHLLRFLCTAG